MIDGEHTTDTVSIMSNNAITVFFSYSHKDEALRDELANHLEILKWKGDITDWHDRKILPGDEWDRDIKDSLNAAQIILLLISSDFIASRYCWDIEITRAMERHEAREARVIPVILRKCMWSSASFGRLQALPKNATPVTDTSTWPTKDHAFTNIAEGIKKAAQEIQQKLNAAHKAKLDRYEATYQQAIQQAYPLSEAAQGEVNRLQAALNLSDADIAPIVTRLSAQYGQGRQKLEQYRQEVRLRLEKDGGELSTLSRSLLNGSRISFGLTPEEATAVETEELQPIRAKQEAKARYTKVFADALKAENPLNEATRRRLQRFQQTLELSNDETATLEQPILESAAATQEQKNAGEQAEENQQGSDTEQQKTQRPQDTSSNQPQSSSSKQSQDDKYTKLEKLLSDKNWKDADEETANCIQKIMRSDGKFSISDFIAFPCLDLISIDDLWIKYSDEHFGFSAQAKIWNKCGKPESSSPYWTKFGETLGWRQPGSQNQITSMFQISKVWRTYESYIFSEEAPEGHLPRKVWGATGDEVNVMFGLGDQVLVNLVHLLERLERCRRSSRK
jgi:hypothetical protein